MRRLFPPVADEEGHTWDSKGRRSIEYLTVNGPVQIRRRVYWNRQKGSVTPVDQWLGMTSRYSLGVRQLCCREAAGSDFRTAAENLFHVGQLSISHETVRGIAEGEGRRALTHQRSGALGPGWGAEDCRSEANTSTCIISGADGVKVPLVTEAEKKKRRQRRAPHRKGQPKRRPMHRGSDGPYKEFKLVAFYDPSKEHQYAVGTSGNHHTAGQLMRQIAGQLKLDQADLAYSVSDGAEWIRKQYHLQLPMLKANILDYYHLRDNVIKAAHGVYGQGSVQGQHWREQVCGYFLEQGPEHAVEQIKTLRKTLRAAEKRKALEQLIKFVEARREMTQYPQFKAAGYEIGSGPTEAFCKTLTARLKGQGMRWDKPNAEAMMALASMRSSHLWQDYWDMQRKIPA